MIDLLIRRLRELRCGSSLSIARNRPAPLQHILAHGEPDAWLLLVAQQRQVCVEKIVRGVALASSCILMTSAQHVREGVAGHGPVCAAFHLEVEEQAAIAGQDQIGRIEPSFSNPRTALILSSPGQSSCFSILQEGCAITMRRMTFGAVCTPLARG